MRRFVLAAVVTMIALPLLATEPNASPRQRELIEKLFIATNSEGNSRAMMDAMFAQIEKQFLDAAVAKSNDPDDIAEAKEMFAGFRERAAKIDLGGLMHEATIRIYAKYFNEQELADLVTFYATPSGRKAIEVMPHLLKESMQAGAEYISPRIEELMKQVRDDQEKKRPWRKTIADIRSVSTALEAYAIDHDDLYPAGDYAALKDLLAPEYVSKFPEKDMWDHAYAYTVSEDRKHYRIVSAGADTIFDWDSRTIVPVKEGTTPTVRYRPRLEDDFIYADGSFVQLPTQAMAKN